MLTAAAPALVLAPMEGVTDAPMRALQGECGAFTYAVSEFLRVSQNALPAKVFFHHVPELRSGARTSTGLPVQVQLLGGDPDLMAASAVKAVECGATAIDLNFGCPAPTVNRHDGGATLLKYPKRLGAIVAAVRAAVPATIPVSAKMRLGWERIEDIEVNAAMAAEAGANWVTVHARTRTQGYAPPVFWPLVGRVREMLNVPVIANGDIWTLDDFRRCRDETGCIHFMLGRGALGRPGLANAVAKDLGLPYRETEPDWPALLNRLIAWTARYREATPQALAKRMKQWLRIARQAGGFDGFDRVKHCPTADEILETFAANVTPFCPASARSPTF